MRAQVDAQTQTDKLGAAEALFSSGELAKAEAAFRELLGRTSQEAQTRLRLGQIARLAKQFPEALDWLRQALELQPNWAEAYFELASTYLDQGDLASALENLEDVLALEPAHIGARRTLADVLQAAERWREAVQHYAELLPLQPEDPELFQSFGLCCQELGELDLAEKAYQKTLNLGLDSAELQFNLGLVQLKKKKPKEAIARLQKALEKEPALTLANLAMANAYRQLGDLESAESSLREELKINPNCADAAVNLGVVLQEKNKVGEAIHCYRKAIELNPHHPILHWNFAIASLLAGDYKTGWSEYEWRWRVKHKPKPKFEQPEWDGTDLHGRTILLYAEQGFGDTIMFARYVPWVAQKGARIIIECQPPLKRLLACMPFVQQVISDGEPRPDFDVHAPLMSLPRIFGSTLDVHHRWEPYLRFPTDLQSPLPDHDKKAFKVGLAWASNPLHPIFSEKSVSLTKWEPIIKVEHCEFFSLQVDPTPDALNFLSQHPRLHDLHERLGDFADTAMAIQNLDLIISVDTAVAHLAGAFGHPVWVMLSYSADWRWLLKRKDSPWYPTMHLFRQPRPGDWDGVIAAVARELDALVTRRNAVSEENPDPAT
jgi:tetratricopeptide (TPR) repeat protein